jgi:hypothetical protein
VFTVQPQGNKYVVGYGCMLDAILFIRIMEDREWINTLFLLHLETLGAIHHLMVHTLRVSLA